LKILEGREGRRFEKRGLVRIASEKWIHLWIREKR